MHAQDSGDLHDLGDLFRGRSVTERVRDVDLQARAVQVCRRDIERDIDEFLHLGLKAAAAPRHAGELQVRG